MQKYSLFSISNKQHVITTLQTVSQHKKSSNDSDHSATNHSSHLIDIVDFAPDQCFTAGGAKVLFIGGWYLRGHDYSVMFDDRLVKATLVHPGVLRCFTPPHQAGIVKVEVYCDGKLGSHSAYFEYVEADLTSKQSLAISELSQRMSHLQASLTGCQVGSKTELTGSNTEQSFMKIVRDLMQRPVNYSLIISSSTPTSRQHTGNNILHLCSLLNFHQLLGLLLEWRTKIPTHVYIRDLDATARDTEGRIPLHLAAFNEYLQCVHYLVLHCPSTLDVLDDRGETPHDIILRSSNTELICVVNEILTSEKTTIKSQTRIDGLCYTEAETADSTVLWDVTNGEATTSEQQNQSENQLPLSSYSLDQQQKDCSYDEGYREATDGSFSGTDCSYSNDSSNRSDQHPSNTNLESENWIDDSISMDVRIPDSPTTAHVWSVLTRSEQPPDENARARMASLAQQIIDALPDRIKSDGPSVEDNCMEDMTDLSEPSSSGLSVHSKNPFLPNACMDSSAEWDELIGPFEHSSVYDTSAAVDTSDTRLSGPLDVLSSVSASPSFDSSSVSKNSATARAVGNNEDEKDVAHSSSAKALGEFFAADGVIGPLEKCFHDLRLTGNLLYLLRFIFLSMWTLYANI
ncbi:hypothetical protein AB6A40_010503 [Gnathostoma spinigerum]|uniref:IPT/TIG domain-containing protein n=1 Tax=Gnathostoma spinigerum TaxID=75299 RepID=A0ABD6F1P1_9BILA